MVLHWQRCGRVGRRRINKLSPSFGWGSFVFPLSLPRRGEPARLTRCWSRDQGGFRQRSHSRILNPKSWCSSLSRLRASMVAPATRTIDKVAWTISSALRAREERSPVPRPDPRSASAGSVRVANHAGAAPNIIPVNSDNPRANASTTTDGAVLTGRKCELWKVNASRSLAAAIATSSPAMPPPMESRRLSVRASVTIWRRVAPTASRTAVCPWRTLKWGNCSLTPFPIPRASSAAPPARGTTPAGPGLP